MRIIQTAPNRYKVFEIPKRSGGTREIAQPAREVKVLQRIVVDRVLATLPIHPAATAYKKGSSIAKNAALHAGRGPILKMDFEDFFPSIRAEDFVKYAARKGLTLDPDELGIVTQICFRRARSQRVLRLSIGAPSSPMISNVLLYDFDVAIAEEASKRKIAYSRYADDITFSGQRIGILKDMIEVVQRVIRQIKSPKLRINASKTTFVTAAYRRTVTGVVLSNDAKLSLGHNKKRLLSSMVHRASLGKLNPVEMAVLAGHLGFAKIVEPEFLARLAKKYGHAIILTIQRTPRITRAVNQGGP
jgi:retron-type reverse transcriptase